jgi:hypothetical protein
MNEMCDMTNMTDMNDMTDVGRTEQNRKEMAK